MTEKQLQQEFREKYIIETADNIQEFSDQNPRILRWLFEQQRETAEEDDETRRTVVKEWELRKLDTKYFQALQKRERKTYNAQRRAKRKVVD